jgi:hypothetical protein
MTHRPTPRQLLATHALDNAHRSLRLGAALFALYMLGCLFFVATELSPVPLYYTWSALSHPIMAGVVLVACWLGTLRHRADDMMNGNHTWENISALPGAYLVCYSLFVGLDLLIVRLRPYCGGF